MATIPTKPFGKRRSQIFDIVPLPHDNNFSEENLKKLSDNNQKQTIKKRKKNINQNDMVMPAWSREDGGI